MASGHPVFIDGGNVHLRGAITAETCSISTGHGMTVVDMGQLRSNQFSGIATYGPPVPFSLFLTGCRRDINDRIAITFQGVADGKDPQVLEVKPGINTASGVGLAIFDRDGEMITPNALPHTVVAVNNNPLTLRFIARYRATSRHVVGGQADVWTHFTVSYQ